MSKEGLGNKKRALKRDKIIRMHALSNLLLYLMTNLLTLIFIKMYLMTDLLSFESVFSGTLT